MLFSSYTFASGKMSLDTTPYLSPIANSFVLTRGIIDDFYLSTNTSLLISDDLNTWEYDTVIYAQFNGNLEGGNAEFNADTTDFIRLKRRQKGTFDWVNLYEKDIGDIDDFNFIYFDYTARSNTEYEYALVPVTAMVEGVFSSTEIKTNFIGLFIMEKDKYYTSRLNVDINSQQQNKPIAVVSTMGQKYPFVISNGMNNYKSGNINGLFAKFNEETCELEFEDSWKYREELNDFLYDNYPKLIKHEDGRMWLASISSPTITETEDAGNYAIRTSFDWTEIGNCDNGKDLYDNGLLDVYAGG